MTKLNFWLKRKAQKEVAVKRMELLADAVFIYGDISKDDHIQCPMNNKRELINAKKQSLKP